MLKARPKFKVGDRVRANEKAPGDYRDRVGLVTQRGPGKAEYGVRFDDGQDPDHGHLDSWRLDRIAPPQP